MCDATLGDVKVKVAQILESAFSNKFVDVSVRKFGKHMFNFKIITTDFMVCIQIYVILSVTL
jgi:hypothetical protein